MAITVSLLGQNYSVPESGDVNYDQALTNYLKALPTAFPQLSGGTYSLTAELDFGPSFGLKALYVKTESALPATTGVIRLAKGDAIAIRNNANSTDLALKIDTLDALTFGGQNVTGNPLCGANSIAGQSIPTGVTETVVVFATVEADTDSGYNNTTGRYTVPAAKAGHYEIAGQISYTTAPGGTCTVSIYKNATLVKTTQFIAPGAGQSLTIAATLNLAAGDIIDVRTKHGNAGSQSLTTTAAQNYIALKRIPT